MRGARPPAPTALGADAPSGAASQAQDPHVLLSSLVDFYTLAFSSHVLISVPSTFGFCARYKPFFPLSPFPLWAPSVYGRGVEQNFPNRPQTPKSLIPTHSTRHLYVFAICTRIISVLNGWLWAEGSECST